MNQPACIIPLMPLEGMTTAATGHVEALLHQVARELQQLAANPAYETVIDLHALLDAQTRQALRARLGQGEVQARVLSAGLTELTETAYPGCWWQRQGSTDAQGSLDASSARECILITRLPALLAAHTDDLADAARRLQHDLTTSTDQTGGQAHG